MPTTIHYFGKIRSLEMIAELQEELAEISQVSGWTQERVDHVFSQEDSALKVTLKGIRVTLNKTATALQMTFDRDGYLSHIFYEPLPADSPLARRADRPRQLLHQIHTHTVLKTSDAPTHVALVKLLDYVKKKYVPNLEVIDNTGYWYSRDESVLKPRRLELAKK